ncbi:MAG: hypothetical protein Kow0069_00600 [Promethearchaeota archaeon]
MGDARAAKAAGVLVALSALVVAVTSAGVKSTPHGPTFHQGVVPGAWVEYAVEAANEENVYWNPAGAVHYSVKPGAVAKLVVTGVRLFTSSFYDPATPQVFANFTLGNLSLVNEPSDFLSDHFLLFAKDFRLGFVNSLDWDDHQLRAEAVGASFQFRAGTWGPFSIESAAEVRWSDQVQRLDVVVDEKTGLLVHANCSIEMKELVAFELTLLNASIAIDAKGAKEVGGSPLWVTSVAAASGIGFVVVVRPRKVCL